MIRSLTWLLLAATLALPTQARPGPGGPFDGPGFDFPGPHPRPGRSFDALPVGVATVLIAGLTYYMLDGIYYRPEGDHYVVVEKPATTTVVTSSGLTTVDVDGRRYYVRDGRYYQRDINGQYIEVPPPAGLR
mgnify:CR=1 FL=1